MCSCLVEVGGSLVKSSICLVTSIWMAAVLYDAELKNFDPFNSAMSKQTLVKISKLEGGDE